MLSHALPILCTLFILAHLRAARAEPGDERLSTLQGDDGCGPGDPRCNVCLSDVPAAFNRLGERGARVRETIHAELDRRARGPRFSLRHYQGVARFTADDDTPYLVLSRSARRPGRGRLEFVRLPRAHEVGTRRARLFGRPKVEHTVRVPFGDHPGGMQIFGTTLALAVECEGRRCKSPARVLFYDVSRPGEVRAPIAELVLDGRSGEPLKDRSKASAVAITRLEDGRFLVYVGGRHSGRYGDFFVSEGRELETHTRFRHLDHWSSIPGDPAREAITLGGRCEGEEGSRCADWGRFENMSFVTECGTRAIYLIGMGERRGTLALYRLRAREGSLDFEPAGRAQARVSRTALGVSLRNGGGVRVDDEGRGLELFITGREPGREGKIRLARLFTPHGGARRPETARP